MVRLVFQKYWNNLYIDLFIYISSLFHFLIEHTHNKFIYQNSVFFSINRSSFRISPSRFRISPSRFQIFRNLCRNRRTLIWMRKKTWNGNAKIWKSIINWLNLRFKVQFNFSLQHYRFCQVAGSNLISEIKKLYTWSINH
jgi:hypothetical protein